MTRSMRKPFKSHSSDKATRSVTVSEIARCRVVIENVKPEINGGRFAAKRAIGERMTVEADIFADGHDAVAAMLLYRREQTRWTETLMAPLVNDRWHATFEINETGTYLYTLQGWVDRFETWRQAFAKKVDAEQDVALDLLSGAELVEFAAKGAGGEDRKLLTDFAARLRSTAAAAIALALDAELSALMKKYPDRRWTTTYDKELRLNVERSKARLTAHDSLTAKI